MTGKMLKCITEMVLDLPKFSLVFLRPDLSRDTGVLTRVLTAACAKNIGIPNQWFFDEGAAVICHEVKPTSIS